MTTSKPKKKRASSKGKRAATPPPTAASTREDSGLEHVNPAEVPLLDVTVAIHEPVPSNQKRATEVIEKLGYRIAAETGEDGILARLAGNARPQVLLCGLPGGEKLLRAALDKASDRPVVVASVPGPAATARDRAEEAEADLFVLRPHSADQLAAILSAATRLAVERDRVQALRGTEEILRERLARYGQADVTSGFQHFDFIKQFLVMELKRARRYGYSLAAVLVAIDPRKPEEPEPSTQARRKLRTRVASAIASSIRDIDLPIDYAEDRMLVFLPFTDLEGATSVGKRVAVAVRSYGSVKDGDVELGVTVSIGIAAIKPGKPVSFARLMKDAGAAVRAAQLKGGGRIVVRK
jgi:diguanylate cyclase (GGDEF)-like protein